MGTTLEKTVVPERTSRVGSYDFAMSEGRKIELKLHGGGMATEKKLDDECPSGKKWTAHVHITVRETDVS